MSERLRLAHYLLWVAADDLAYYVDRHVDELDHAWVREEIRRLTQRYRWQIADCQRLLKEDPPEPAGEDRPGGLRARGAVEAS